MRKQFFFQILLGVSVILLYGTTIRAQPHSLREKVSAAADKIVPQVITWRRDFHAHPELGNHEVRTSGIVADYLRSLGLEVKTGVAKTGVIGILKGGHPGPVVALRADMDALPITEPPGLPFASTVKAMFNGNEVGVMHACGHDAHTSILMGVATVLSSLKSDLRGTVKFIFQPAEEGPPIGEEGGAALMVKEGVLESPHVDAIFGLHMMPQLEVGKVAYRPGGAMAAVNDVQIIIKGKGSHGAMPWLSVDPIVTAAQVINNLQTIVSRNLDLTENPGVVTIGSIHGGNRSNIIPDSVVMVGTIRALSPQDEKLIIRRVKEVVSKTAESAGAEAEIKIPFSMHYPVTYNDPSLTAKMLPSLRETVGPKHLILNPPITGAEDFSYYEEKVPGLFVFLGGMPVGEDPQMAPGLHTARFFIDESSFKVGINTLANLAIDYLNLSAQ
jgi:amidohydrolase